MLNVTDTKRKKKKKKIKTGKKIAFVKWSRLAKKRKKPPQIIEISSRGAGGGGKKWPCDCDALFLGNKNSEVEE